MARVTDKEANDPIAQPRKLLDGRWRPWRWRLDRHERSGMDQRRDEWQKALWQL